MSTPSLRLTADGRRLRDRDRRTVLLRGVNTGGRSKLPPFFPFPFGESGKPDQAGAPPFAVACAAYFDRVAAWGHDAVRLPFTWEAVEPERGRYDDVFLDRLERMVRACGERGLRVIADFHQDIYARPFGGDGFPLWTIAPPIPDAPPASRHWFLGYVNDDRVRESFDRFWGNVDGLRDACLAMWRHVSARLWCHDAVIGFEVINEPGWGTADLEAWAPSVLTSFYEEAGLAIRAAAPGALVFFDTTSADGVSASTFLERPRGDGFVFAPHYYEPSVMIGAEPDLDAVARGIAAWDELGARWDLPVLLGEFGAPADAQDATRYVRANWDALDRTFMHGTTWEYSTTADDWNDEAMSIAGADGLERPLAAEAVRVFPRAIAGEPRTFRFDAAACSAVLEWDALPGVTEIAAPRRLYLAGPRIESSGAAGASSWDASAGLVRVSTNGPGPARVELARRP